MYAGVMYAGLLSIWNSNPPDAPAAKRAERLDLLACAVAVALILLVSVDFSPPLRLLLASLFTFFVPGRAIVSNWARMARWSGVGMSIVFSLGALTLLATITLWAGLWHPLALFLITAMASLAGLAVSIVRRRLFVPFDDE